MGWCSTCQVDSPEVHYSGFVACRTCGKVNDPDLFTREPTFRGFRRRVKLHTDANNTKSGAMAFYEEVECSSHNAIEAETTVFKDPTCASYVQNQAMKNDASNTFNKPKDMNSIADETDSLSDIDDTEVVGYLNNEEEFNFKKIIWEQMNKEYLQEQAAKQTAVAVFKDMGGASAAAKSREKRRRKQAVEAKNARPAQSAADASHEVLKKKRLSSKINFDVLRELFEEQPSPNAKRTPIESQHASTNVVGHHFSDDEAYTGNNNDEAEQEDEDTENMVAKEKYIDGWYFGNEEEVCDSDYYGNDEDNEY